MACTYLSTYNFPEGLRPLGLLLELVLPSFLSVVQREESTVVSVFHTHSHRARNYNSLLSKTVLLLSIASILLLLSQHRYLLMIFKITPIQYGFELRRLTYPQFVQTFQDIIGWNFWHRK